jgi:cob(I)alamin adenosyltransferase
MVYRLYTRNGDSGSSFIGSGIVSKDSNLIEAVGAGDAFISSLDRCCLNVSNNDKSKLQSVQYRMLSIIIDLCGKKIDSPISDIDIKRIEQYVDELESPIPKSFVRFNSSVSCDLNESRIKCREFERRLVSMLKENRITGDEYTYVNRVSDYLFCLAFHYNKNDP